MDFVSNWKVISITSTAAFGVLGLLTEFKDRKTNRLTGWGKISLIGILISGYFSVISQISQNRSEEDYERNAKIVTDRELHPLGPMRVYVSYKIPCTSKIQGFFCSDIKNKHLYAQSHYDPEDPNRLIEESKYEDGLILDLYRENSSLIGKHCEHIATLDEKSDLQMTVNDPKRDFKLIQDVWHPDNDAVYYNTYGPLKIVSNNGSIIGENDLVGTTFYIYQFKFINEIIMDPTEIPEQVYLEFKSGRSITIKKNELFSSSLLGDNARACWSLKFTVKLNDFNS